MYFFLSKIKYLGQVIDKKGRTPDPYRADAIKCLPTPTNAAALQSFGGGGGGWVTTTMAIYQICIY